MIFISIDDNEVRHALNLLVEIFGEGALSTTLIRQKKKKPSFLHSNMGSMTEYVLCATRSHEMRFPFSVEPTTAGKKYPLNNAGNAPATLTFPPGSVTFNMPNQIVSAQDMSERNIKTELLDDVEIRDGKNVGEFRLHGEWRYSQTTLDGILESGEKIVIAKTPFRPNHVKAGGTIKKMHNLLTPATYNVGTNEDGTSELEDLLGEGIFDNPKPTSLVKLLTKAVTYNSKDATILDFFSGSGTTAHAVMELNAEDGGHRRHIQVQLPEPTPESSSARKAGYDSIADISRERIKRAGQKILESDTTLESTPNRIDAGFRAYKLSDTNFTKWHLTADAPANEVEQRLLNVRESSKDSATQDALLTELLIKQGMSLTERVRQIEVAGLTCHAVVNSDPEAEAEDQYVLIAYVDEHTKPTIEQLRAIVELQPARLVILEDAFQGDDQLKTNLKQMCVTNDIELKTA
ncbi:DNA methyltransferase [Corynebacterium riegelii]|uniref:DNA methyltransferase n=1 Tax=Corynebacterium riegelii TaxID=156976 RepID=UPI0030156913